MEVQNNYFRLIAQWNNRIIICQEHIAMITKGEKILVPNIEQKNLYLMVFQETSEKFTEPYQKQKRKHIYLMATIMRWIQN